jgi:molybdate transport system permease protein
MMDAETIRVLWFTVVSALLGVALATVPALALAWLLARRAWQGKSVVETLVALPMVIPPVATGLILLKLLGRRGPLGALAYQALGMDLAFNWKAVPLAMAAMALPLMVRGFRVALEGVNPRLEQVARTLGASEGRVLLTITLPLAGPGLLAALVLGLARSLGEFGATVILAGNIPGQTTTLSLALYRAVELGHDDEALFFLGVSLVLAFGALWLSGRLAERMATGGPS